MRIIEIKSNCFRCYSKIINCSDYEIEILPVKGITRDVPTKFYIDYVENIKMFDFVTGNFIGYKTLKKYSNGEYYIHLFC